MSNERRRFLHASLFGLFALAVLLWRAPDFDFFANSGDLDHGYQIALGQQVHAGLQPGRDFFTQYGPAIAWLSGLSWSTGFPWLIEVLSWSVFLAVGYALLWLWLPHDETPFRKSLVLAPALLFTPFYSKYYFVLFPALFLIAIGNGPRFKPSLFRYGSAGLIAGIAGLFRFELGVALMAAGFVFLAWEEWTEARRVTSVGFFATMAIVAPLVFAFVISRHGRSWPDAAHFLDFQLAAIAGKVSAFSRNEMSLRGPWQRGAVGAWSLLALTVFYATTVIASIRWRSRISPRIFCAGLVGLSLLPQLMHNTGLMYALQIGLPATGIIAVVTLESWKSRPILRTLLIGTNVTVGLALGFGSANFGYVPWSHSVVGKFGSLASCRPRENSDPAVNRLAAEVNRYAAPGGPVLQPDLDAKIYPLIRHRWAGLVPHLTIPLPEKWQQRCVDALRADPPAIVLLRQQPRRPPFNWAGQNPLIDAYLRDAYPTRLSTVEGWILMGPRKDARMGVARLVGAVE